jgi:hypothetical protein
MKRFFIGTTNGVVDYVLEIEGPAAAGAPVPPGLTEITGHPQATSNHQALLRTERQRDGSFVKVVGEPAAAEL